MINMVRSIGYAVILLGSSVYSLTAKEDAGPPYNSGPSVMVPFYNVMAVSDPTQYVSPQITIGFSSPNATSTTPFQVTMDTGSVGIVLGKNYFAKPAMGRNDPTFVGPGTETLTSSGVIFTGDWYMAAVNLYSGNKIVATSMVPVMALISITCEVNARSCAAGNPDVQKYMGVGFGGGDGQPQGTPDKNAFLNVTSLGGLLIPPSPGYILSTQGVQIGLTSSNTRGFAMLKLEPLLAPPLTQWQHTPASPNVLTDWQHARGTITVNGKSANGGALFDTGVNTAFLTPPKGAKVVSDVMGPTTPIKAECNTTPPTCAIAGTMVEVSFPNKATPIASLNYTVGGNKGPANGPEFGNPVSPIAVSVESSGAPFLNTSVRFLQAFTYLYDAANGFIGLRATHETPAQYATSTPSRLAVEGVFQCFLSWATGNDDARDTKYSWPYTYRTGRNMSVAVSSGSSSPAMDANAVYILGIDGQPPTNEGDLSPWLSAAGCQ